MSSSRCRPILGISGRTALADCFGAGALLAFDFDGTLAPLAEHPDQVRLASTTRHYLEQLHTHRPVAVISGRSMADVQGFLPSLTHVLGNHGGEGEGVDTDVQLVAHDAVRGWIRQLRPLLSGMPGVMIEDKGPSLALHYRACKDHASARITLEHLVQELDPPPRLMGGHAVLNIIPPGLPDKGVALRALMDRHGYRTAIFIGDDLNDDMVFRRHDPDVLGIKVGEQAPLAAPWFLDKQQDIDLLLHLLLRFSVEGAHV
jgi:trehalose 6-phosphate phosphatase